MFGVGRGGSASLEGPTSTESCGWAVPQEEEEVGTEREAVEAPQSRGHRQPHRPPVPCPRPPLWLCKAFNPTRHLGPLPPKDVAPAAAPAPPGSFSVPHGSVAHPGLIFLNLTAQPSSLTYDGLSQIPVLASSYLSDSSFSYLVTPSSPHR